MHLIVAFAAPPPELGEGAARALQTPALDRLLADWAPVQRDAAGESTLSAPHERALAAALGLRGDDGCLPWAARQAALDGVAVGTRPWGLLTPVHCRVGSDGVHLADPTALALDDADSHALFDAVRPLFESEGCAMAWGAALRWYAAHDSLQGLATASLDRVIGRQLDAWLPRQPDARRWRRLQNEAQMLLHALPLNQAREAAGALLVNSCWLSGCGASQAEHRVAVRLDERLRHPALQGDGAGWCAAWQALDREAIAPLLAAAARGEAVRLTLCGLAGSIELAPRRRGAWQRLVDAIVPARSTPRAVLESL
jgi:hypothetical protein